MNDPEQVEAVAIAVRIAVREALKSQRYTHDQVAGIAYTATIAAMQGVSEEKVTR